MSVGIDEISFYTPGYYIDLMTLANAKSIDGDKYYLGIGQEKMSMAAHDEDVVTMAANSALPIIKDLVEGEISTLLFATETGIDQSKAAGVYVHRLLQLNENCRVVELKQACFSATAALQMACAMVSQQPEKKVLVIASDIARYELDTPGEATQGCGAVAMLVAANPKIIEIAPEVGNYTEDVMDFWRPNYRTTALVDGKLSAKVYLKSLAKTWEYFQSSSQLNFSNIDYFCYHLPFVKMAKKAHQSLAKLNKSGLDASALERQISDSLSYSRIVGNCYAASLYLSLSSLLENCTSDLAEKRIGFYSYGSGCVAEFFSGKVVQGYQKFLHRERHLAMLESRKELTHAEYLKIYSYPDPHDGKVHTLPRQTKGLFRLAAIANHKREYEIL